MFDLPSHWMQSWENSEEELLHFPNELFVFPLNSDVLFPGEPAPVQLPRSADQESLRKILQSGAGTLLTVCAPYKSLSQSLIPFELGKIATVTRVLTEQRLPSGDLSLGLLGMARARVKNLEALPQGLRAEIERIPDVYSQTAPDVLEDLEQALFDRAQAYVHPRDEELFNHPIAGPLLEGVESGQMPLGLLCDALTVGLLLPSAERQAIFETLDSVERAEKLIFFLDCHLASPIRSDARVLAH